MIRLRPIMRRKLMLSQVLSSKLLTHNVQEHREAARILALHELPSDAREDLGGHRAARQDKSEWAAGALDYLQENNVQGWDKRFNSKYGQACYRDSVL